MASYRIGYRGCGDVSNSRICTEAAGNNCGIYCDTPDLRTFYRGGKDAGVQSSPEVVGEGPHTVGMQWIQLRVGG